MGIRYTACKYDMNNVKLTILHFDARILYIALRDFDMVVSECHRRRTEKELQRLIIGPGPASVSELRCSRQPVIPGLSRVGKPRHGYFNFML